jgi:hypothetical protein
MGGSRMQTKEVFGDRRLGREYKLAGLLPGNLQRSTRSFAPADVRLKR